jgi:hypothetical protein
MPNISLVHSSSRVQPDWPGDITGRDRLIIAQALARFIATEAAKPDEQQYSNLQDARAILRVICPDANRLFAIENGGPLKLIEFEVL